MKRLVGAVVLFLLANIAIFYVALGKFSGPIKPFTGGYPMHVIAFFGLSLILSLILMHEKVNLPAPFTLCFIYAIFIAVLIEILQSQTGYRTFSLLDILAGAIGAIAYSVVGVVTYKSQLFHKYWVRV